MYILTSESKEKFLFSVLNFDRFLTGANFMTDMLSTMTSTASIYNYELLDGNEAWRFGAILIIIVVFMAAGKIVQYFMVNSAVNNE